jgi:hypothetical protein
MAKAKVPPMSPEFARWYRSVDFGEDRERVERRWAGAVQLAANAGPADTETLVRLAFHTKQKPSNAAEARIRLVFRDVDELFDAQRNERELQILAGATLHIMMMKGDSAGGAAALSVSTAASGGGRIPDLPVDLVSAAEVAIETIADRNRKRPELSGHRLDEAPDIDFEKSAVKVREGWNQEHVAEAFELAADAARAAVATFARRHAGAAGDVARFISIQDEELQMLWWLIGGRSWDLDCGFSAITADAQPLVLAKELAGLTGLLPEPRSIKGLLSRAGISEQKRATIPNAVNACPPEWLRPLVEGLEPSPVTQPIHFAIKRKLETGEGEAWIANWTAVAGIDPAYALPTLVLGSLFYRERLLALFSGE